MQIETSIHPLQFAAVSPMTAARCDELTTKINQLYEFSRSHSQFIEGDKFITYTYDLSNKNISLQSILGSQEMVTKLTIESYVAGPDRVCRALRVTWEFHDGAVASYATPPMNLALPHDLFSGDEIDVAVPEGEKLYQVLPDKSWDNWMHESDELIYRDSIHPAIVETVRKIVQTKPEQVDLLDVGGGTGALSCSLLEELDTKIRKITTIDKNPKLVAKAREACRNYPGQLQARALDVVEEEIGEPADIIILCGLVAYSVLSKEAARKVFEKCLQKTKDNGFLIITSFTRSILNTADFERANLRIFNKSIMVKDTWPNATSNYFAHNFYILQKTAS